MIERRYTAGRKIGVEKRSDGTPMIVGYAAVYYRASDPGTEYTLWDGYVERMMPGAFDQAIQQDDVRALFNHDANFILGRNTSGTLRLFVDEIGLRYEIDPPNTDVGKTVLEGITRGDITGSSFGFAPVVTQYREENKGALVVVERTQVSLFDVSPVTFPAYTATSVGVRSGAADLIGVKKEIDGWMASKVRSVSKSVIEAAARVVQISR